MGELGVESPAESSAGETAGRIYSGRQSAERTKERQRRLIEAGIEIFGTVGFAAAKIKTLCQSAGLSERYFYESFASKEELLCTVHDHLTDKLSDRISTALQNPGMDPRQSARAGMGAVVGFMLDDPRHGHIMLVEIVGISADLEEKRHVALGRFAASSMDLLVLLSGLDQVGTTSAGAVPRLTGSPQGCPPASIEITDRALLEALDFTRLTAVSMVGGVNNMLLDALLRGTTKNADRITDVAFQLICNASLGIRALAARDGLAALLSSAKDRHSS